MSNESELFHLERSPFRLKGLEIYNWGPFTGLHRAEIDTGGTAIIGMTGSGKTTLIDAYVTLLTERPKYNLASTGGHESDRDLLSYIRGVVGSGNDSGDSAHISRKGKTTTGLCATYTDGKDELRIGGILWIDGNSFANADLKRAWVFSRNPGHSLEQWLAIHSEGGLRRLKQALHDSSDTAHIYDASGGGKSAYLARVRDFFEVSDNAFALLNRAAGLKQLNSIDQIFRELVLDDHSQFVRASEVIGDFDRLTEIHEELLTAQRQQRSLLPVQGKHTAHLKCRADLEQQNNLKRLLPLWVAESGSRLWAKRVAECKDTLSKCNRSYDEIEARRKNIEQQKDTAHQTYLETGGSSILDLDKRIQTEQREFNRLQDYREQYTALCAQFQLPEAKDRASFDTNYQQVEQLHKQQNHEHQAARANANQLGIKFAQCENNLSEIQQDLEEAQKHTSSNLQNKYLSFRSDLASALNLSDDTLPFVAELIEVKASESNWRGAIEHALGGNRTRILVPEEHIKPALRWVNTQGQHKVHIRLFEAQTHYNSTARFMEDGLTRKLNYKEHPLREAVKHFLSKHDLHCVDSPDQLATTAHALTQTGLTSGKQGYFEKKDHIALTDEWYTGFDNRDRIKILLEQQTKAKQERNSSKSIYEEANKNTDAIHDKIVLLDRLTKLSFEEIDTTSQKQLLNGLNERLRQLKDPNSDATKAYQTYEQAAKDFTTISQQRDEARDARTKAIDKLDSAKAQHARYQQELGTGLTVNEASLVREHIPLPSKINAEGIGQFERDTRNHLEKRLEGLRAQETKLQTQLVDAMNHALNEDTGALAEAGTSLEDIPAYLERLRILNEEALPDKQKEFLSYLNQSSDQGVTQLLTVIDDEVGKIRDRIDELNRSLQQVDFRDGRYLRLEVQDVTHDSLRSLLRAIKQLRSAYAQREENSERHFKALREVIAQLRTAAEKKHTRGAQALLDPRYRVEFKGAEIERSTGTVLNKFKGSQSGSGGEKEIIASYILTASLCYALSPGEGLPPLHSTILLDEAFSKSSRTVARRIINALREFQLHPIFVTPDKEMRLLREHTKSVINVHRKGFRATLTSIRWEELEARIQNSTSSPAPDALT